MNYVKFLIGHPSFQYNQIYKTYHIYNQNKHQVNNKIYIKD